MIMEVKINREIRNYTESMFFGLSLRQFFFSIAAMGVAVLLYFLLKPYVGTETVSWMCVLGAAPFAALGFITYHGMTAEQFIWAWLLIVEIIIGFLRLMRKTNEKTVCLPKIFFTSGTVASIIFIIIVAIALYNGEESWIPIFFSVFSIISLMLTVAYLNCRITYDESEIICRNLLGFTKKYSYDDIIGIENWDSENLIFFGKEQKVISVDYCLLGGIEFVVFINKKYSLLHMGKDIPHIRNTTGIFKGNVKDEPVFVFLLVVIALLAIGFSLLIIKLAMPSNIAIGIIIAIVIDVICALYIAMTIIVGRNPQKFGKRFVRLFFKEGYVRY